MKDLAFQLLSTT